MRQELIWRAMQVIEIMERETGFEPATSSLGNWANVVNREFSVSGRDFRRQKITEFPSLCFGFLLMEYKWSTRNGFAEAGRALGEPFASGRFSRRPSQTIRG